MKMNRNGKTQIRGVKKVHSPATTATAELYIHDDILTDAIFCNTAAYISYETLVVINVDERKTKSTIWISHDNLWMTRAMEDLQKVF